MPATVEKAMNLAYIVDGLGSALVVAAGMALLVSCSRGC